MFHTSSNSGSMEIDKDKLIKWKKESEIVKRGLWDHYSELPNPSWYEYKEENDG